MSIFDTQPIDPPPPLHLTTYLHLMWRGPSRNQGFKCRKLQKYQWLDFTKMLKISNKIQTKISIK